ncbi:DapH/DapD/GlmU-related protein [Micromonospora sp. M12]
MHIGDDFFGNVNLTFVDDVEIRIGNGVMIAPGVTLTTTGHPVHPDLRVDFRRFSEPILIEDKVWIGSNAVVLPGVRIGFGAVVGAGSVVTRHPAHDRRRRRALPDRPANHRRGPQDPDNTELVRCP